MKKTLILFLALLLPVFALSADEETDNLTAENIAAAADAKAQEAAQSVTLSAASDTAEGITLVGPESASVAAKPADYKNSIGIDVGIPGRIIPGISYSRVVDKNVFTTVFAGIMYDGDIFMALIMANGCYMFTENFYAGLGFSAALDEDASMLFGIGNPTVGLTSEIFPQFKFFIETTVLLFKFTNKPDTDSGLITNDPLPIMRAGVRYSF